MKRILILLLASLFLVSGKVAKEKYYVVMWNQADITEFLNAPNFDKAVFNFTGNSGGHDMSVAGFDVNEKLIGCGGGGSKLELSFSVTNVEGSTV